MSMGTWAFKVHLIVGALCWSLFVVLIPWAELRHLSRLVKIYSRLSEPRQQRGCEHGVSILRPSLLAVCFNTSYVHVWKQYAQRALHAILFEKGTPAVRPAGNLCQDIGLLRSHPGHHSITLVRKYDQDQVCLSWSCQLFPIPFANCSVWKHDSAAGSLVAPVEHNCWCLLRDTDTEYNNPMSSFFREDFSGVP